MTFERPMSRRGLLKTWCEGKKKGRSQAADVQRDIQLGSLQKSQERLPMSSGTFARAALQWKGARGKKGKVSGSRCPAGHTTRQPSKIPRETADVQRDIREGCSPVERERHAVYLYFF